MQHVKEKFRIAFNGNKNFMTPDVIEHGIIKEYYYELSKGLGFYGGDIFGVTIIDHQYKNQTEMSKCFDTLRKARKYITSLE